MIFSLSHVLGPEQKRPRTTIEEYNPEGKEFRSLKLYFDNGTLLAIRFTETDSLGRFITNEHYKTPETPLPKLLIKVQQALASFEFYQKKGVRT